MRILKWLSITLVALAIVLATAVHYLTVPLPVPADCPPPTDWSKIRALAASIPGDKPREVRVQHLLTLAFPEALVLPGASWSDIHFDVASFQVVYPDRTVMIDAGMSEAQATQALQSYDSAGWAKVKGAMETAAAIYVTHEHCDHMGGLFAAPGDFYARVHLTPEQMASPERLEPAVISAEARAALVPLQYDDAKALAPGIVVIKKPGHTPGSQWFFISRADGTELLLLGDTAWFRAAIDATQGPPQIMSMLMKNDRHANACQIAEIKELAVRDPNVRWVPGHDPDRFDQLVADGSLVRGFL